MRDGTPVPAVPDGARPYLKVAKWRWALLNWGLPAGLAVDPAQ
jgi:hypothetical protein